MNEQIIKRIEGELGLADLTTVLSDKLSGADLHSLLLTVLKRRIEKIEARNLSNRSAVTKACDLDGRVINKLESTTYEIASQFKAIELAPVSPLGTVSLLTGLDQGNVLSTVRGFECAADPTVSLALECARIRKSPETRKEVTRLCTNQRVIRFPAPSNPAFTAHFKLFSLVTAGRDAGSFTFEIEALREHIGVYLKLLSKLSDLEFGFQDIVVELCDTRAIAHLCSVFSIDRAEIRTLVRARDSESSDKLLASRKTVWPKTVKEPSKDLAEFHLPKHIIKHLELLSESVAAPLSAEHAGVQFVFNMHRLTGLSYYDGPCFHIKLKNNRGDKFALADGGFVNWTQVLLNDGKERLMTSAIGTELICRMFHK